MEEAILREKAAVMDALAAAGISTVRVDFRGDSGGDGIEYVAARSAEKTVPLPATGVIMLKTDRERSNSSEPNTPLPEAIKMLCLHYLAQEYAGWEDVYGMNGTVSFDVASRVIELEIEVPVNPACYSHGF